MAIPRNGSRLITVDGLPYRWKVRPGPIYAGGTTWVLTYAVQAADAPGPVLVVDAPAPDDRGPGGAVTPGQVAEAIRSALDSGWRPRQPGRPVERRAGRRRIRRRPVHHQP